MSNSEVNICFLDWLNTNNKVSFNKFYNFMYAYLKEVHIKNEVFKKKGEELFDDLFQQSMLKLVETKDRYNPKKSLIKTYFSTMFYNNLVDFTRKKENKIIVDESHINKNTYIYYINENLE